MDRLTIGSVDGHAQMPPEAWPQYLDKRYHDSLPGLIEENRSYTQITAHFTQRLHNTQLLDVFDAENALSSGGYGVWDRKIRIQEMDRAMKEDLWRAKVFA